MRFLRRVLGVLLRDKEHRSDIRKARDVKQLLRNERSQLQYIRSAMCPKCPRKEWRTKSLRTTVYTHWKAGQSLSKDHLAWLHFRPCLVPSWCGASRTTWDCCWSWGILGPHKAAATAKNDKNSPINQEIPFCTPQKIGTISCNFFTIFEFWPTFLCWMNICNVFVSFSTRFWTYPLLFFWLNRFFSFSLVWGHKEHQKFIANTSKDARWNNVLTVPYVWT